MHFLGQLQLLAYYQFSINQSRWLIVIFRKVNFLICINPTLDWLPIDDIKLAQHLFCLLAVADVGIRYL